MRMGKRMVPGIQAALIVFLLLPALIRAGERLPVLSVGNERPRIEIAANSDYLFDSTNSLTWQDLLEDNPPFRRYHRDAFQFSFEMSTLWFRCHIKTRPGQEAPYLIFDNMALGSITLHVPVKQEGESNWVKLQSNWWQPFRSGAVSFFKTTFALPDSIDPDRPVLIRVFAPATMYFRATLYTSKAFLRHGINLTLIIGFCLGILGAMLLYNLVLFFFVRDRYYFVYILYVLFLMLWQSTLLGLFRYFWPDWGGRMIRGVLSLGCGMVFFGILFALLFLHTKKTAPLHDKILKALAGSLAAAMLYSFFGNFWIANYMAQFLSQIATLAVFTTAIAALRSGYKPARYYLAAVSVMLIAALIFFLRFYGLLPSTIFTMHAILFGSAAEAVLLSFALGDRIRLMRHEEERLRVREKNLQAISITDDLTGLYNRRFLNAALSRSTAAARRSQAPLSLLMLDVDRFKQFNDTWGHPEGDRVLAALGNLLQQVLRGEDVACRYGGEEFVIILHHSDLETAVEAGERIRTRFAQIPFYPVRGKPVFMTISIGVAQWHPDEDLENLISRADQAMYAAKKAGRNQVQAKRVEEKERR